MPFTIIAHVAEIQIFNRRVSARDALLTAWSRRQAGARAVFVHDAQGAFVSASALAVLALASSGTTEQKAIEEALGGLTAGEASPSSEASVTVKV